MEMADYSVMAWIYKYGIKNEKGDPIDFVNHLFLYDIYRDQSDHLVVLKAAQVGLSTLEIFKNIFDAKSKKMDIIYTLPTDGDVKVFVSGKVNRIIANNPILLEYTQDKDSIEQKQIGESMLYFRGTWTEKAAIMVTADRLVHDEKDSSKQDVVADYQARLQHSKYKQIHVFSHPSSPNMGVDIEWQMSDQKEWFITCPHCKESQYLTWNTEDPEQMNVDLVNKEFICKKCKGILDDRKVGEWKKQKEGKYSGYHISLLMAPWVTAKDVIEKYDDVLKGRQTMDYFYNKVLGLPYAGSGNSVTEDVVLGSCLNEKNTHKGRIVVGVDTGVKLRYVVGNSNGLMGYGEMTDYISDEVNKLPLDQTIEYFLKQFDNSIMVIDQGGDIIGSRKLQSKYPGRVFLCHYAKDRKTQQLIRWGDKDETGVVLADRNRMIQLVIDELKDRRMPLYGTREDWYDYWLHWSHIYRINEENTLGVTERKWERSDRDDWVHATVYFRIGISRFGGVGRIDLPSPNKEPDGVMINPNQTVDVDANKLFTFPDEIDNEWR